MVIVAAERQTIIMSTQAEAATTTAAAAAAASAAHSYTEGSYAGDEDATSTRSESNMENVPASSRGEIVEKVEDMDILCGRGW